MPKIRVPQWLARWGAYCLAFLNKKAFYQPWLIEFATEHFHFEWEHTKLQLDWIPKHSLSTHLVGILKRAKSQPQQWRQLNERRPWRAEHWTQLEGIADKGTN
jgi:hypothetical protein